MPVRSVTEKKTKAVIKKMDAPKDNNYIEIRLPKLNKLPFSAVFQNRLAPIIILALFVMAYLLGSLSAKLHLLLLK